MLDRLLYQWEYKKGELASSGWVQEKEAGKEKRGEAQKTTACIDWYLVTTYHNPDGTTTVTEEYLYTTCSHSIDDELVGDGTGGGGGGDPDADEPMSYKTRDWVYAVNNSGYWAIVPTEGFNGIRKISAPNGGRFTSFVHVDDGFMRTSNDFEWHRTQLVLANNVSSASVTMAGNIWDNFYGTIAPLPSKTQSFTFNQVY